MVHTAELLYLLVCARLLMAELIAGETNDDESLVLVLLVKGFQSVLLGSETAL